MKDRNGVELERGDILLISIGNYFDVGIFVRPGVSNNLNYYSISNYVLLNIKSGRTKVNYITTSYKNHNRYVKIPKELLTTDEQDLYDQIIKLI
jgi:hypothetical protein